MLTLLLLLLLCSFDASSWPQLNHRGCSIREGVAVVKPSCVSGFDRHEGPWAAPSIAPDGLSPVASSLWLCPQQPASIFSFHFESFWGALGKILLVQLVRRLKTATAKWIRVNISLCQLWYGYLLESTERMGGTLGIHERRWGERTVCAATPLFTNADRWWRSTWRKLSTPCCS